MARVRSRTKRFLGAWRLLIGCLVVAAIGAALSTSSGAQTSAQAAQTRHCPRHSPGPLSPSSWAQSRSTLAPTGASVMRLCRYSGLNAHPRLALVSWTPVDSSALRASLVYGLDRLPRMPMLINCPSDDGSRMLALLGYPGGHQVTISVGLSGCETVTNGRVTRTAAGTSLVSRLKQLARSR